jgi:hypothetical protein
MRHLDLLTTHTKKSKKTVDTNSNRAILPYMILNIRYCLNINLNRKVEL